jgi:hypothetical protein
MYARRNNRAKTYKASFPTRSNQGIENSPNTRKRQIGLYQTTNETLKPFNEEFNNAFYTGAETQPSPLKRQPSYAEMQWIHARNSQFHLFNDLTLQKINEIYCEKLRAKRLPTPTTYSSNNIQMQHDDVQVAYVGESFISTFQVKNSGKIPWPAGCALTRLPDKDEYCELEVMQEFEIEQCVNPGQKITVSVILCPRRCSVRPNGKISCRMQWTCPDPHISWATMDPVIVVICVN